MRFSLPGSEADPLGVKSGVAAGTAGTTCAEGVSRPLNPALGLAMATTLRSSSGAAKDAPDALATASV